MANAYCRLVPALPGAGATAALTATVLVDGLAAIRTAGECAVRMAA